jgi:hypothetical protein
VSHHNTPPYTHTLRKLPQKHPPHPTPLFTLHTQENDTIRLKREAKASGGFYVEPEAKLAFVMRIRGLNKIHPKV